MTCNCRHTRWLMHRRKKEQQTSHGLQRNQGTAAEAAIKGIALLRNRPRSFPENHGDRTESSTWLLCQDSSWFRKESEPEPAPKPERKPQSSSQRDGRRGGRGGNRRDEEREGREPRQNREPKEARPAPARDRPSPGSRLREPAVSVSHGRKKRNPSPPLSLRQRKSSPKTW